MATILCVDDDRSLADLVCYTLERAGYTTRRAHTTRAALALLRSAPIDLVLLDLGLPDGTGLTALATLQSATSVPVILLTAWADDRSVQGGLAQGAAAYLVKPVTPPLLLGHIAAALSACAAA